MALQGDLSSFALPDVLRLLAGTAKSGRLVVQGDHGSGEVWLRDGDLVGGSATTSPHASQPADVLLELLRFDGGSFSFDGNDQLVDGTEPANVEEAIRAAESLAAEWAEVEAVVPSLAAWLNLVPEVDGEVTVTPKQWKVLASVGSGRTVASLGDHFELTDLAVSRRVKALVEAGLIQVGEAPEVAAAPAVVEPEAFDATVPFDATAPFDATVPFDAPAAFGAEVDAGAGEVDADATSANEAYARDLALLSAEDGPVVLESSDDAHLPEPLPGEGTSFVGDLGGLGTVDGRSFEAIEAEAAAAAPPMGGAEVHDAGSWSSYGSLAAEATPLAEVPSWDQAPEAPTEGRGWDAPANEEGALDAPAADPAAEDDDRGSLLKFLSSVKP